MAKQQQKKAGASKGRSFAQLTKDQIAIYAKELNEHFQQERRLRMSLHARDEQLEQRAREVTALNQMLPQHLLEWYKVAQEYREVLGTIKEVLRDGVVTPDRSDEMGELIDSVVSEEEESDLLSLLAS